jgi:hypothetical protein
MNNYFEKYPISRNVFFANMLDRYGVNEGIFFDAPFVEQARSIHQIFGYSNDLDISLDHSDLLEMIHNVLYLHESSVSNDCSVSANTTQDPIGGWSIETLIKIFMDNKKVILKGLRDALIPIEKGYQVSNKPLLAINGALVPLLHPIAPKIDFVKFWEESVTFSWNIKSGLKEIPF